MANARIVSSSKWKELICNDEIQMLGTASAKRNARVKDTLIFCTLSLWFLSFKKPIKQHLRNYSTFPHQQVPTLLLSVDQPWHLLLQICGSCCKRKHPHAQKPMRVGSQFQSPSCWGDKQITNPNLPLPYDLPNHQFSGANMFVFSLGKLDTLWYLLPGC